MSGFFSGGLGSLGGLVEGSGGTNAAGGLLSEVFNAAGGVPGIVSKFEQAGLGDKVQSWVGQGSNLPVAVEDIERVFPPQQIESFAEAHGIPAGTASQLLAHLLPHAIDNQTPDGQVPGGQASDEPSQAGTGSAAQGAPSQGLDFGGLVQRLTGGD
ncbi:YidB family protein [Lichenicola sp.]|uniref:YidB family protein n=1 Tax=Lichenicola sp. TaxID=2804529 RepID=UPI003AFFEC9C